MCGPGRMPLPPVRGGGPIARIRCGGLAVCRSASVSVRVPASHPAFMPRAQQKRKHQNPLLEAQLMAAKLCNHLQGMTESRFYDSTLDF